MIEEISIDTKIKLNNSVEMPIFGLGTYQTRSGKETQAAVLYALEAGYRLIDTAKIYGNEKDVGEVVRKSGIPREEVFITTKLWNSDHGYEAAIAACEKSLKSLGLSYIDLYLIHWPVEGLRNETWRAMETLQKEGKCRAIGVSNYMIWHLEELLRSSSTVPAVNQVEFSPYLYQKDLLEFCRSHNIQLEAYSPLTKGQKLSDPKLVAIASRYSKSPAQMLIRWVLQHGVIVIPKSSKKERIFENADVFDFTISPEDKSVLDSFNENLRTSWDPSTAS
ncbi:MAG: glyoxal reductase [candidate division Zixibacteria bacterium SM1_73]|nr:MAG: glyoxal reductase [candidate division Zixibacteria bacterium SM1_73]